MSYKEQDNQDNEESTVVSNDELGQDGTAEESIVISPPAPIVLPSLEPALSKTGDAIWGEPKPAHPKSDMEDLFEVPQLTDNDMYTDDLFEVDDQEVDMEDDLSDLTRVTEEDIMGSPPKPKLSSQRSRRTGRPYNPPTSLGGIR